MMKIPDFSELLAASPKIVAEFAIAERLRRNPQVELHPTLFNSPLIYGPEIAVNAMTEIYVEYVSAAQGAGLPMLLTAPTWRLDSERIGGAGVPKSINSDAVEFLINIRNGFADSTPVLVGALVGPKSDCYRPELAPSTKEAEKFHSHQIEELVATNADYLQAQTLPSVDEALGISRAMADSGKPYVISFCTGRDGNVLDGTPLPDAMSRIDREVSQPPVGYYVNCTHPKFLLENYAAGTLERLIGIQANSSSKDVALLDSATVTESDPLESWADSMLRLQDAQGLLILGGCCGTNLSHLKAILSDERCMKHRDCGDADILPVGKKGPVAEE